jgi:hypothetical protein
MQRRYKELRPKIAATSRRQEDIQQDRQPDSQTGGREASSRIFRRAAENERLDTAEDSASTQTEEEITSGLPADAVGTTNTPGHFLPVNRRNDDALIGYSRRAALKREQCDLFAQSKNCGDRKTAIVM